MSLLTEGTFDEFRLGQSETTGSPPSEPLTTAIAAIMEDAHRFTKVSTTVTADILNLRNPRGAAVRTNAKATNVEAS
jgi:hypothetical protein